MKSLIIFTFIAILNSVTLFTCDDCDAVQYQIYEINHKPDGITCEYKTRAMTNCAAWRHQATKNFTDNCAKYEMSHYFLKTWLFQTYP